jgi:uncharacterized membrane protein
MITGIILTVVIIGLIIVAGVMYKNRHRTIANVAEDKANDVKDLVDKAVDKAKDVVKDAAKDIGKKIDKKK